MQRTSNGKWLCLFALSSLPLFAGCGGGGSSTPLPVTKQAATVAMCINWAARTRAIAGPASALSAIITLQKAGANSADFTWNINRETDITAHQGCYKSPSAATVGTWPLHIDFYAQSAGAGAVVATVDSTVTIKTDGSGLDNVSTVGTTASVTVNASQSVSVGQTADLTFAAANAKGTALALTQGSATFAIVSGSDKLTLTPDGKATGVAAGTATVTATVDGIVSAAQIITISTTPTTPTNPTPTYAYTVTDLGLIPTAASVSATLQLNTANLSGLAVGWVEPFSSTHTAAATLQNGKITMLASVPGSVISSQATDVNDSGQIVGSATVQLNLNGNQTHAYLWQNGSVTDLGAPLVTTRNTSSNARAISSNGTYIVGDALFTETGAGHAGLYTAGKWTDIVNTNTLDTNSSEAYAVNDKGDVTGYYNKTDASGKTNRVAFVLLNGKFLSLAPPNAITTRGLAININGDVIGDYYDSNSTVNVFLWQAASNTYTVLTVGEGDIGTSLHHLNDSGQVMSRAFCKIVGGSFRIPSVDVSSLA